MNPKPWLPALQSEPFRTGRVHQNAEAESTTSFHVSDLYQIVAQTGQLLHTNRPLETSEASTHILVEQQPPQGVFVCDHAGLVVNKISRLQNLDGRSPPETTIFLIEDALRAEISRPKSPTTKPKPQILVPAFQTLNPQSSILNPQSSTLNPQLSTPNPKSQTPKF